MDFAPAFAVGAWTAIRLIRMHSPTGRISIALILCGVGIWWGNQIITSKSESYGEAYTFKELTASLNKRKLSATNLALPSLYTPDTEFGAIGIPFNGNGWNTNGATKAAVTLFFQNPERLVVEVGPAEGANVTEGDCAFIRAKVGLEFLRLAKRVKTENGWQLEFEGPRKHAYQKGLQTVFIGFVNPRELSDRDSKFRLLRVQGR